MRIIKDENGYIDMIKSSKHYFTTECLKEQDIIKEISSECFKLGLSVSVLTAMSKLTPFALPKLLIYYTIGKSTLEITKNFFPEGLNGHEKAGIIINSNQYQECLELYINYVKNIVNFYKSIDKKTALEIATFFDIHLGMGLFTPRFTLQQFQDFKYANDIYIPEISGSTVMTGISVCRHNAPLLSDILYYSDIKACNLPVIICHNPEQLQKIMLSKVHLRYDHMVTGIIEENKSFIYDPTSYTPYYLDPSKHKSQPPSDNLIVANSPKLSAKIVLTKAQPDLYEIFNSRISLSYKEFINTKPQKEDIEYQRYLREESIETGEIHKQEILDFNKENRAIAQKIKTLNESLAPRSNKKIKTWKIK